MFTEVFSIAFFALVALDVFWLTLAAQKFPYDHFVDVVLKQAHEHLSAIRASDGASRQ